MSREVVLAISAITAIYVACAASIFTDPAQKDDLVITRLALAAILSCAISFAYFVGKLYCSYWMKLGGNSKFLQVVETVIVPLMPTAMVPGLSRAWESRQWTKLSVFILLFAILMDLPRAYRAAVAHWFPEPKFGDRILFLQFPPRQRADMLPMDIALVAFFALLTVPFVWLAAGRYASYWLRRNSRPRVVRSAFVVFWALFTAKLFFLGWPQSGSRVDMSLGAMSFVAMCALFSGYASVRAFRRIASGQIAPIDDAEAGLPASLWHSLFVVAFALYLMV